MYYWLGADSAPSKQDLRMTTGTEGVGMGFAKLIRHAFERGDRVTMRWTGLEKGVPVATVSFDPGSDILTINNGGGTSYSIAVPAIISITVTKPTEIATAE
jgi:hypothetical protein